MRLYHFLHEGEKGSIGSECVVIAESEKDARLEADDNERLIGVYDLDKISAGGSEYMLPTDRRLEEP
jgi:hypothetical protein